MLIPSEHNYLEIISAVTRKQKADNYTNSPPGRKQVIDDKEKDRGTDEVG